VSTVSPDPVRGALQGTCPHLLTGIAKTVIEAALEAELVVHLDDTRSDTVWRNHRGNSRNGSRRKTVRTTLGAIEIDAPRDRWGTFEPVTVGKWRREGAGIDRVLLPLAAKGTPPEVVHSLLSMVYPSHMSDGTLWCIVGTVRDRLRAWHEQELGSGVETIGLHLSALRGARGQVVGLPFATVVGSATGDLQGSAHLQLLSLHAVPPDRYGAPWGAVLEDLRRRGVTDVRTVLGDGSQALRDAVSGVWADAEVS
jgi:transposase-like protein